MLQKVIEFIKKHYLFLIFLSIIILIIFFTYKDYGITWDEIYYVQVGRHFAIQILNALKIPNNLNNNNFIPTDIHLQTHGVFFDVLVVFLSPFFHGFSMEIYHLIKALLSLISFVMLYFILLKFVPKKLALLGVVLLALFPHFYGDIFNNSIDIPTLTFFTIYIGVFLYFLDKKNSFFRLILLSFCLSILIDQRIIFLYVLIISSLFLIKQPKKILLLSLLTFFFMHLTHPYLLMHPIFGLVDMLTAAKRFPFTAANLFDGQFVPANQLPWYYIPKLILVTTPLSTLILFFIGNFYLSFSLFNKKVSINLKTKYFYLLSLFYAPFIIIFILKPDLYDSWRHFLFLVIPLIIIAVFGAVAISKINNYVIKYFLFGLIAFNLFQTGLEMKTLHPYQYVYYNQLVGGLKGASRKYETDYWGAANKEAIEWFNQNINNSNKIYYIAAQGDPLSSTYYFKKNMIFTFDFNVVNYVVSFTRWNFDQLYSGKIIHVVEREGVPLVYIKSFP